MYFVLRRNIVDLITDQSIEALILIFQNRDKAEYFDDLRKST